MPIMDGFQSTQKIRSLISNFDGFEQPKIVALTAYTTEEFELKCLRSGMDGFLSKPIVSEKLKKFILEMKLLNE